MTKTQRPSISDEKATTSTSEDTTAPTPSPQRRPSEPDRLEILDAYTGSDGLLPVYVAVAHDAVFMGQYVRVPVTERVAGLIEKGFLEVCLSVPERP